MSINSENFAAEWDQLKAEWAQLAEDERRRQWDGYTEALDFGDAGYHPYHLVLAEIWDGGLTV